MEALMQTEGPLAAVATLLQHLQQQEYVQRANIALAASFVGGLYLHFFLRRIALSYTSLVAVAPLTVVNCCVPLLFSARSELPSRIAFCINTLWLQNFKALGLCCHRGPLVAGPWSAAQTVLLYMLPLYPRQETAVKKGRLSDHIGSPAGIAGVFASSAVLLGLIAFTLTLVWLPTIVRHYLLGLFLYAFINFMMAGPAAILVGLLNMEVVPAFDKPWLSTSLADYWSRRWNNTTSLLLRALVYDPIVEGALMSQHTQHKSAPLKEPDWKSNAGGKQLQQQLFNIAADGTAAAHECSAVQSGSTTAAAKGGTAAVHSSTSQFRSTTGGVKGGTAAAHSSTAQFGSTTTAAKGGSAAVHTSTSKPSLLLKAAALTGTFAVSGLMHELVLYLCNDTDGYRFGFWFVFFVVQAPLLIVEGLALQKLRKAGVQVPKALGIMYSTFFVLLTAYLFWYPPLENHSNIARVCCAVHQW